LVLAVVIFFGVKEMPRGQAEPELEGMETGQYRFSWQQLGVIMKKRTMWFIFLQGFAGVFPWNVITYMFFLYLENERGYDEMSRLLTMGPIVLILAGGYFVGGALGDWAFKRTVRGRIIVSSVGVLLGAIFLYFAINTPVADKIQFFILMALTALFMPLSSPNVISTVFDITPPEVRSTAQSVEYLVESFGAAFAPWMAGILAVATTLATSILTICTIAWLLCFVFYLGAMFTIKKDVHSLRTQMEERANIERAKHSPAAS